MSRYDRMRERLPSLYRPEAGDDTLLGLFLSVVAESLDGLEQEAGAVMRAHWFSLADRTVYHPYYSLIRQRSGLAPLRPGQWFDITDPEALVAAFAAENETAIYLRSRLSPTLAMALTDARADKTVTNRRLSAELQRLPFVPHLYEPAPFAALDLPAPLQQRLDEAGFATDPLLNRDLLIAVFTPLLSEPVDDHYDLEDLTRLGALLGLSPLREPTSLRESAESFRLRMARWVRFYRNGIGTLPALRRLVEALLPVDPELRLEERDRPFLLEAFPSLAGTIQTIEARGQPHDMLGPLMRWQVIHTGMDETRPTLYLQGVTPVPGEVSATVNPMVERLESDSGARSLGLAYDGTLAPGETLRLRPAIASWLGFANGPRRARALPQGQLPGDPTAPGPWNTVAGAPSAKVAAFYQGPDAQLWVALSSGILWSYDGSGWQERLQGLSTIFCVAGREDYLLLGTEDGLKKVALFPEDGVLVADAVPGLADGTQALCRAGNEWWVGHQRGLSRWPDGGAPEPFGLHADLGREVAVQALCLDRHDMLFAGTPLGLFQYQFQSGHWYYYVGGTHIEAEGDWRLLDGGLPEADEVFLPGVTALARGHGSDLWLGTDRGLARYLARPVSGTVYETVLEAFPDLGLGRVAAIVLDPQGQPWFATERGLLRYDGRDMWHHSSTGWKQLGAATARYDGSPRPRPRGSWRFQAGGWASFSGSGWQIDQPAVRIGNSASVFAVAWTPIVAADLGTWDGITFQPSGGVGPSKLKMRYKPAPDRIVDGGIAALPTVAVGNGTWRYLRYQPTSETPPAVGPAWNSEGRLVTPPPKDAPWPARYLESADGPNPYQPAVFAFDPAVRLWMTWPGRESLTVLVRLQRREPGEILDTAIIDRVWEGLQQFRPAGVRVLLALDQELLRGV